MTPLSPERFAFQFALGKLAHDRFRYAQELLSHEIPSGDIAAVVEWMTEAVIPQLERRKFAATEMPRPGQRRASADTRHISAEVKRAVWEREARAAAKTRGRPGTRAGGSGGPRLNGP